MQTQASVAPSAPTGRPTSDPIEAHDGPTRVAADATVTDAPPSAAVEATPLFTRHKRGAMDAERDTRRHHDKHRAATAAHAARRRSEVRRHPRLSVGLEARRHELVQECGGLDDRMAEAVVAVPVSAGV